MSVFSLFPNLKFLLKFKKHHRYKPKKVYFQIFQLSFYQSELIAQTVSIVYYFFFFYYYVHHSKFKVKKKIPISVHFQFLCKISC